MMNHNHKEKRFTPDKCNNCVEERSDLCNFEEDYVETTNLTECSCTSKENQDQNQNEKTYSADAEELSDVPRVYNTEGTPKDVSSAASVALSDQLDSDKGPENNKHTPPINLLAHEYNVASLIVQPEEAVKGKLMLETPLMFSRCSSYDSLSSYDPPDDKSSIVSEFSLEPSGIVSPSELPDSPTQTVHPTSSMFDERVKVFKEENTPVEFSTTTSLSGLTFDEDQPLKFIEDVIDEKEEEDMLKACINFGMPQNKRSTTKSYDVLTDYTTVFNTEDTPINISHATSFTDLSHLSILSEDSDKDVILAECIQSGMPQGNSKLNQRQNNKTINMPTTPEFPVQILLSKPKQPIPHNIESSSSQEFVLSSVITAKNPENLKFIPATSKENSEEVKAMITLSRQQSVESLDDDWTEDQDQILLEQCITSGMPKTTATLSPITPPPTPPSA